MGESRGSIAFFTSYGPPVPLDIFCCPVPALSRQSEIHLTDGLSYNYNCQPIPLSALKTIIKRLRLAPEAIIDDDVDSGRLTGLVFVSEREHNLETLYVALRFIATGEVKVFSFANIYTLFVWLISHQPAVLFSQNKSATSNQPAVLLSQNKPAPVISHQPNEHAAMVLTCLVVPV
jgi:hypothetical protein